MTQTTPLQFFWCLPSSTVPGLLNQINRHNNIKFPMNLQENNTLSYIDTNISVIDNKIETTIYRKPTFSGLGSSFFGFTSKLFKINAIKTLLTNHISNHKIHTKSCSLIDYCRNTQVLPRLESLHIFKQKPDSLYISYPWRVPNLAVSCFKHPSTTVFLLLL